MATTTNYSWTTPDDTDLVKDGASAIRSLGTAIDSTVFTNAGNAVQKSTIDAKGDLLVGTADNTVGSLAVGTNNYVLTADSAQASGMKWAAAAGGTPSLNGAYATVATQESTTSSTFTDLTTSGPAVTVTTGTKALIIISASQRSTISGAQAQMSFAVSGATTRAVQTNEWTNTSFGSVTGGINENASAAIYVSGLTAGSNTFTAKYAAPVSDSVSFQYRKITVVDLGS